MTRRKFSMMLKFVCLMLTLVFVSRTFAKDQWVFLGDSLTVGMVGDGSQLEREVRQRWGTEYRSHQ